MKNELTSKQNGKEEKAIASVTEFSIYPNPFNPSTVLSYKLSAPVFISLKIYDILGREVAKLINEFQSSGRHTVSWNASTRPSGVYFYRLEYGGKAKVGKMLLAR